jgi:hypothetical protein
MRWVAAFIYSLSDQPTFTWFGQPPVGPHVPFGNPALIVFDSLRVLCFVAAAAAIILGLTLLYRPHGAIGQQVRLFSSTGLVVGAAMTEAYRFGDYANLRLIVAVICLLGQAWGNYLGVRYEKPPAPRIYPVAGT